MTKGRLEAFSDGVFAILITILVLELHTPHGADWAALGPVLPEFLAYLLSFVFLGIYWNNHHHMLHLATRVNGKILWANLHLLFWLSLIPFVTGWMGEHYRAGLPVAAYGFMLLLAAVAFTMLERVLLAAEGPDSRLARAVEGQRKERISLVSYLAAIPLAFVETWISIALFVFVAFLWIVPDRRIETHLER